MAHASHEKCTWCGNNVPIHTELEHYLTLDELAQLDILADNLLVARRTLSETKTQACKSAVKAAKKAIRAAGKATQTVKKAHEAWNKALKASHEASAIYDELLGSRVAFDSLLRGTSPSLLDNGTIRTHPAFWKSITDASPREDREFRRTAFSARDRALRRRDRAFRARNRATMDHARAFVARGKALTAEHKVNESVGKAIKRRDEALSSLGQALEELDILPIGTRPNDCNSELPPRTVMDWTPDKDKIRACKAFVATYLESLHEYNEMKDTAQALVGMIAEQRGMRVQEVLDRYGVPEED